MMIGTAAAPPATAAAANGVEKITPRSETRCMRPMGGGRSEWTSVYGRRAGRGVRNGRWCDDLIVARSSAYPATIKQRSRTAEKRSDDESHGNRAGGLAASFLSAGRLSQSFPSLYMGGNDWETVGKRLG